MYNGRAGGIASGKLLRERALRRYYESPNRCLYCDSVIEVGEGQKVNQVKKKKFCNHSHAAKYNNRVYPKRRKLSPRTGSCVKCGCTIVCVRSARGAVMLRRYCDSCLRIVRIGNAYVHLHGMNGEVYIADRTKGELRERVGSPDFRNRITLHAKKVFARSGKLRACAVCGYDVHIDVCHVRAVADFSDDTLLSDINSEENLIALCPNHHWELDHDILAREFLRGRRTGTAARL